MIVNIRFSFPKNQFSCFVHRIRNFSEDLERRLYDTQIGYVLNVGTATDKVEVFVKSKRYLGDVSKTINICLKIHMLLGNAKC